MTLDVSRRAIFPLKPSEGVLVSSVMGPNEGCVLEGTSEKRSHHECGTPRCVNWELENCYVLGKDKSGVESTWEPVAVDILELLPLDPFDMGKTANFAAMSSWMDSRETNLLNAFCDELLPLDPFDMGKTATFAAMSSWMDGRDRETDILNVYDDEGVKPQSGSICIFEKSNIFDGCAKQNGKELELNGCVLCSKKPGVGEGALNSCGKDFGKGTECCNASRSEPKSGSVGCSDGNEVDPCDVLPFCFSFLGVQDLLSMESVCKSLRIAAQDDILSWRSIHINKKLSGRITDDTLLLLTNKAQGHLQSLSLVDCWKITDSGLKSVLDRNPRLTKLDVVGCRKVTVGGLISILKAFKSSATVGIKRLRIGVRYDMTREHFAELKSLVVAEEQGYPKTQPHFYAMRPSFSLEDDRSIDIELCPKCQNVRLVYDCPADSCPRKQSDKQPCRGCIFCIPRCIQCARCICGVEYEETFCLDWICIDCWEHLPSGAETEMKETTETFIVVIQ